MYALDTISFPGFCGSYEEIHGWSQSHYVDFIVNVSNPSSTLSMIKHSASAYNPVQYMVVMQHAIY